VLCLRDVDATLLDERGADQITVGLVELDTILQPGDVSRRVIAESGRCWRMVYDHNLQATTAPDSGLMADRDLRSLHPGGFVPSDQHRDPWV
jgi:hypothetical protein